MAQNSMSLRREKNYPDKGKEGSRSLYDSKIVKVKAPSEVNLDKELGIRGSGKLGKVKREKVK